MPIIGYKQQFKNIDILENETFIINFNLKYSDYGSLEFKNQEQSYFDVGDYRIMIEKIFNEFNKEILKEYDNGILILSICKYLVDNIPNIYNIVYESKNNIDTYYKDEIINDYLKIKNNLSQNKQN